VTAVAGLALGSFACTGPRDSVTAPFDSLSGWQLYSGAGHDGKGTRQPGRVSISDGILTITGEADGSTGGLAWAQHSQRFGRWDVRMRAPAGCACYHPVVLLWGTGGGDGVNNPKGEIDIVESYGNPARDTNSFSVHFGDGSQAVGATTAVDMTQWHVYHLLWRDGYLATWIDDAPPYFETRDASVLPSGPVDVAVQLDWFPQDGRAGGRTATMQVDYITQSTDIRADPPRA
jgi:hypothetical protein